MWTVGEGGDGDGGALRQNSEARSGEKLVRKEAVMEGFSLMRCNRPGEMGQFWTECTI